MKKIIITIATVLSCQFVIAQTDSANVVNFKIGAFHSSALHYYGRVDSMKSAGSFLNAELAFQTGFYISASPVFVTNNIQQFKYAGTVGTAGIRWNRSENFSGTIAVSKPFYTPDAVLVQSTLKAQANASATWLNKVANFTIGADVKFSSETDYGITAGIDHIFKFIGNGFVIVADPSIMLNAGTQKMLYTGKSGGGFLFFPGSQNTSPAGLRLLSYELTAPLVFAKGRLHFIAIPGYTKPLNVIDAGGKISSGSPGLFHFTAGLRLTIGKQF